MFPLDPGQAGVPASLNIHYATSWKLESWKNFPIIIILGSWKAGSWVPKISILSKSWKAGKSFTKIFQLQQF
jgi:hypothetical protein